MLKAVNGYLQFVLLELDLSLNGLDEILVDGLELRPGERFWEILSELINLMEDNFCINWLLAGLILGVEITDGFAIALLLGKMRDLRLLSGKELDGMGIHVENITFNIIQMDQALSQMLLKRFTELCGTLGKDAMLGLGQTNLPTADYFTLNTLNRVGGVGEAAGSGGTSDGTYRITQ